MPTKNLWRFLPAFWLLLFVTSGLFLLPLAGFQNDEALFASGIYELLGITDTVKIFGIPVPLMLMTYLGTLKSWIYALIFQIFEPTVWSVRVPVLLIGGANVAILYCLLDESVHRRVAWIACGILVTEPTFLLTTCFDWGPVALQHLLATTGVWMLAKFAKIQKTRYLAIGFFAFGLGMWDKALFVWVLSSMAVATFILFPMNVLRLFTWRRLGIAVASFAIGAWPLILYNYRYPMATFKGNSGFSLAEISGKSQVLRATLGGAALFGFIPRTESEPQHEQHPKTGWKAVSVWLDSQAGITRTWLPEALIGAMTLLPWLTFTPSARIAWFCVISGGLAWLQMVATNMAGGSAHHIVLIWPFPQVLVAVAVAELTRRIPKGALIAAVFTIGLFVTNTLVSNRHAAMLIRHGGGPVWTDAIFSLAGYLDRFKDREIFMNDWGMLDALRLIKRGKLPLRLGSDPISNPVLTPEQVQIVRDRLKPGSVFVSYTDDKQAFAGINSRMKKIAEAAGYRRQDIAVIEDSHGRPTYEIFEYVKP